jgi:hypothetical protein
MSGDLTQALLPQRADLTHARLADPSAVRRRGQRRAAALAAAAALGVVVLVAGTVGAASYLASPRSTTVPPGSPGPTGQPPTHDPAPTSEPAPTTGEPVARLAPESVILPHLREAGAYQAALEYRTYLSPPRPCDRTGYPSDAVPRQYRPAHGMVADGPGAPSVQMEYVVRYADGSGGAEAYVDELRADVTACPGRVAGGVGRADHSWSIVESGFAGDDSILIRLRGSGKGYDAQDCCTDFYLAVVREGELVVALTDLGWEGGGGDPAFAKETVAQALEFARTLT